MRYLRLWAAFISNCLSREMIFRGNFLLQIVTGSMWFLMSVLTFWVVFEHSQAVAGWSKYEVFFLLGCSHVLMRAFMVLFMDNLNRLPDLIRNGELDFYLAKPLNTQFFISTRFFNASGLTDSVIGLSLMGYAAFRLGLPFEPARVLFFLLLMFNGLLIYYALMMAMVTTSFWFLRFHAMQIWWQLSNVARHPADLFPGRLRFILTYCIPMLVAVNFPVKAFLNRLDAGSALLGFTLALALLAGSSLFFNFALRRYRSASS
jgi:ABC-2 type transport system permease protein